LVRSDILPPWRRWAALILGLVVVLISLAVPSGDLYRLQTAESLSNRAQAYLLAGMLDPAEADARQSVEMHPKSVRLWVNLGAVLLAKERVDEAEAAYRNALEIDLASPEAALGLANLLGRSGRLGEAEIVIRRALEFDARNVECWNGLVALLYAAGQRTEARAAVDRAEALGLQLDPNLLEILEEAIQR
jgi:Flp pilus assembly protein TadD